MGVSKKNFLTQPVRSDSLASQAFAIVKEAIFSGKFSPGEALRELHLARTLQVSQATVREALVQLEQAGLVVRLPNRRTTVTTFSPDEVRDRLVMRIPLEELAFVRASENMTEEDLAELQQLADAIDDGALAEMSFHHFVWDRAGSPVITKTLDLLTTPLFAFLNGQRKSPRLLVEALRSRDPQTIRETIRQHIEGSYQSYLG